MAEEPKSPQLPKVPQQVEGSNNKQQEVNRATSEDISKLSDRVTDSVSSMSQQMTSDFSSLSGAISSATQDTQSVVTDATEGMSEEAKKTLNKTAELIKNQQEKLTKDREDEQSEAKRLQTRDREKEDASLAKQSETYKSSSETMVAGLKDSMIDHVGGVGQAFETAFDGSPIAKGISSMAGGVWKSFKASIAAARKEKHDAAMKKKREGLEDKRSAEDKAIKDTHAETLKEIESKAQEQIDAAAEGNKEIAEGLGTHSPPFLSEMLEKMNSGDVEGAEALAGEANLLHAGEGVDGDASGEDGERGTVEGTEGFFGNIDEHLTNIALSIEEIVGRLPTDAEREEAKLDAAKGGGDEDSESDSKEEGVMGAVIGGIGRGIGSLGRGIKKLGKGIGGAIKGVLTGIAHGIMAFANPMVVVGAVMIGAVIGVIIGIMGAVSNLLKIMNVDFGPLQAFFETFVPIIKVVGEVITNFLVGALEVLGDVVAKVLIAIVENAGGLKPILDILFTGFNKLIEIIMPGVTAIIGLLEKMVPIVGVLLKGIFATIGTAMETIGGIITDIKELILGAIEGVVGGIERFAALDGDNLMSVGLGMGAIAAGLAAFGVGGALAGVGGAIGAFFGGDPVEKFKRFGEIADPLQKAGEGAFFLGQGIKALASVNLNKLGKQIGPFVDAIKEPLQELSEVEFSTAQANVITELLASLSAEGKDALAAAQSQAGAVVNSQINNNMAQSTTSPVFPRTKTIDSPPEMWSSRADF